MIRRGTARGLGVGSILAAALLVGCAPGGASSASAERTERTERTGRVTAPAEAASPSAGAVSLGPAGTGWLAGNRVSIGSSDYDASAATVTVGTTVDNTATEESFDADTTASVSLDLGDGGAPIPAGSVSSVAVAGRTTRIDIVFAVPSTQTVDLTEAVLQLGGPGEAGWTVPLDGDAAASGTEPRDVPASGTADAGGLLFTVTRAQVLPWACADADDYGPGESGRVWYEPGADDEAAVVLWGDILETQSIVGGDTPLAASLTGPDGVASPQIGTVNSVFDVDEGIRDFALCFTVPTPVSGAYTLTWNSYRQATAELAVTIP